MTPARVIPDNLKPFEGDILEGLQAVGYRRAEWVQDGRMDQRPADPEAQVESDRQRLAEEKYGYAAVLAHQFMQVRGDLDAPFTPQPFPPELMTLPVERSDWPREVSYYSLMGLQAARRKSYIGGGWRLYVLAKALDRQGQGRVPRNELRDYVKWLGLSDRQYRRWMDQARRYDLMRDVQAQGGEWMLILPAAGPAAVSMGLIEGIGRKVTIGAWGLIGKGWKAKMQGGLEATFKGQPITRERIQKLYNVPVSTQRYRDNQSRVIRIRNLAKSDLPEDRLALEQEYSNHKGLFVYRSGFLGWHLPNAYEVPFALRGGRGRARKANKFIRANSTQDYDGLSKMRQALSCDPEEFIPTVKLFNRTRQACRATLRKLAKSDNRVNEVYQAGETARSGAELWEPHAGGA